MGIKDRFMLKTNNIPSLGKIDAVGYLSDCVCHSVTVTPKATPPPPSMNP